MCRQTVFKGWIRINITYRHRSAYTANFGQRPASERIIQPCSAICISILLWRFRHPYFRSLHLQLPRSLEPSLLLSWNCRKCSGIFRPILCFFDGRSYQKCDIRRSWTHQTYTCRQERIKLYSWEKATRQTELVYRKVAKAVFWPFISA